MAVVVPTRGIRNKNPFNIVKSKNHWIGKMKRSTDTVFEQFCDLRYGVRAGIIVLRSYIRNYHLDNVEAIINRFAPEVENNTKAYISFVENYLSQRGFDSTNIKFRTDQFNALCRAILIYESKFECTPDYIDSIIKHYNL